LLPPVGWVQVTRRLRHQQISTNFATRPRAECQHPVLRSYAETRYGAKSWNCQRRVVARIEASTLGMDIRYVVTTLTEGSAEQIYDTLSRLRFLQHANDLFLGKPLALHRLSFLQARLLSLVEQNQGVTSKRLALGDAK
jgi:hypothetical protein